MGSLVVASLACAAGLFACGGAQAPAKPTPAGTCTKTPSVLLVPWQPPRPGEKLHFEQTALYDFTTSQGALKGQGRFVTDEVVSSVANDAIEELEVTFVEGRFQPDLTKPVVDVSGTYRVRGGADGKSEFVQDPQQPPSEEVTKALRSYARDDVGQPHWLLRLLTDRTFEIGRETHLRPESVAAPGVQAADIRLTLKRIAGDTATFSFEQHITTSEGAPFVTRGTLVLDIARARLVSIDEVGEIDMPPEILRKASLGGHIDDKQLFRYDASPPRSSAPMDGCNQARTIHIQRHDQHVGDRYTVDEEMKLDETTRNDKTSKAVHVRGSWTTSVEERVTAVRRGIATALELHVLKERMRELTFGAAESPEVSRDGDIIELKPDAAGKLAFTRGGAEVDLAKDFAAAAVVATTSSKAWTTRLATERSYQLGVEQTFTHEMLRSISNEPSQVRIMLSSIDADVATFKLDIKSVIGPQQLFMRGELAFDITNARPIHLHLAAQFDAPKGLSEEGLYVIDDRFRYER